MAIIVTFSVTYSLILPAITVSRDQADEIAGLYLDDAEEVFDIVEDNGDEDELWSSESDVIQHTGVLEDDWDGILIEEETEAETTAETEAENIAETEPDIDIMAQSEVVSETEEETEIYTELGVETESEDGEVFTIRVTDVQIASQYLSDSGELFEVTVTYDKTANIPEGSTLRVTEFSEDDAEYEYARNSVLADKKARGEWVDLSYFKLTALDISILNPDGEKIEPEAPVQVDIRIKELPGVEDLSKIEDTLAIQHHVEVEDGVVVETVFDGNTEAAFEQDTDENVAAEGLVVEPGSVSEEDFALPEAAMSYSDEWAENDGMDVSFQTPLFSTYTVTWIGNGSGTVSNAVSYLYASASNVRTHNFTDNGTYTYDVFQSNNLYLMDSSTNVIPGCISRSSAEEPATGDIYLVYNHTGNGAGDQNVSEADSIFHIYFNHNGSTYADVTVHYVDAEGNPIRRTKTRNVSYTGGFVDTRFADGINSESTLSDYAGTKAGYSFAGVSAVRPDGSASSPHATIHYGYMDGNNFVEFEAQPSPAFDSARKGYLIYDFEGREYAGTTYYRTTEAVNGRNVASGASTTAPRLEWDYIYRRWKLTNGSFLADGSHLYLVYENQDMPTVGGNPKLMQVNPDDKPEEPTITKSSTVNGDGTNTLALTVKGHTVPVEVEKLADVIVIFDDSGSMSYRLNQNGENNDRTNPRRLAKAKEAVNSLADTLLARKNSQNDPLIRMALVPFSSFVQEENVVQLTSDVETFKAGVNALSADGGTNCEDALDYANNMAVDPDRATFIIFVTDGDPTFRMTRGEGTNEELVTLEKEEYDEYGRLLRYLQWS